MDHPHIRHKDIRTTMKYIHLSGRDLAGPLANGMAQIHAWRVQLLEQELTTLMDDQGSHTEAPSTQR